MLIPLTFHNRCARMKYLCAGALVLVLVISTNVSIAQDATLASPEQENKLLVIISHSKNIVSLADVKRLFSLSKKLLPDGDRASLAMLPMEAHETVEVFRFLLGTYPYQMQRKWDRAMFSGKGTAPQVFEDSLQLMTFVAENKGAIGYISVPNQAALMTLKETVNVIAIVE